MTDSQRKVVREDGPNGGRYVIYLEPGFEAEMTYRKQGDGPMIIDHTGVPRPFEGRGIALSLVQAAIEDARSEGFKITPRCSYVVAQFRRHPEWADLRA